MTILKIQLLLKSFLNILDIFNIFNIMISYKYTSMTSFIMHNSFSNSLNLLPLYSWKNLPLSLTSDEKYLYLN
jgi:hypothetical protein